MSGGRAVSEFVEGGRECETTCRVGKGLAREACREFSEIIHYCLHYNDACDIVYIYTVFHSQQLNL